MFVSINSWTNFYRFFLTLQYPLDWIRWNFTESQLNRWTRIQSLFVTNRRREIIWTGTMVTLAHTIFHSKVVECHGLQVSIGIYIIWKFIRIFIYCVAVSAAQFLLSAFGIRVCRLSNEFPVNVEYSTSLLWYLSMMHSMHSMNACCLCLSMRMPCLFLSNSSICCHYWTKWTWLHQHRQPSEL